MGKIPSFEKASKPIDREYSFFLKAALIIISVCLVCEVFVFNARHFITYWGDEQLDMNNAIYDLVNIARDEQSELYVPKTRERAEIVFPNIKKRIVTVYIDAVFDENVEMQGFQINFGDEANSDKTTAVFNVTNGVEESKYVMLWASGKVSHLSLLYGNQYYTTSIRGVTLNKPVPLKIFWPRVLLFSAAAFCIVVIKHKKLFSLPLKSDSKGQMILTLCITLAFIAYLFVLMLLTAPFSLKLPFKENFADEPMDQYNAEVVDALLDGHAYLNIEPPEKLLTLKNPYDPEELRNAGLYQGWPPYDHAFYNGKFYSYFGIVQVLVLSLPYKLITGHYIPTRVATFIFSALASVFLMLIWQRLVFRYMKKMPLGMHALGQLTVAMCSCITFSISYPAFYEATRVSALFFTTLGLWLVLGSTKNGRINKWELIFGSFCMALAVGCRPNYMLFLLLIPIVLWEEGKKTWRDKQKFLLLFAYIAVPCAIVASGLMWYNYIRFGSVFEFGSSYQLTVANMKGAESLSPFGKISKFFVCLYCYLVPSFDTRLSFPFIYLRPVNIMSAYKGYIFNIGGVGVLLLPITWFIFGIGAVKKFVIKQTDGIMQNLIIALTCLGFLQIAVVGFFGTHYQLDILWLFIFAGLFYAYFIYERIAYFQFANFKKLKANKFVFSLNCLLRNVIIISMIVSIILVFLVTFSSSPYTLIMNNNPSAIYFIQRLLGFNTL
jgi:hypothetical protein